MRDPSKAAEIFEKLQQDDPALFMELLEGSRENSRSSAWFSGKGIDHCISKL